MKNALESAYMIGLSLLHFSQFREGMLKLACCSTGRMGAKDPSRMKGPNQDQQSC